jgi:hypothetical protein
MSKAGFCLLNTLADVEEETFVEDAPSANPIGWRLRTRYSHSPSALHRPFCNACGRRGKPRSSRASLSAVFLNSSIPQPGFRKSNHMPSSTPTVTSEDYPLFQPELRVLLSFLYISYPFPHYPSRPSGDHTKAPGGNGLPMGRTVIRRFNRSGPRYPDKHPVFHSQV